MPCGCALRSEEGKGGAWQINIGAPVPKRSIFSKSGVDRAKVVDMGRNRERHGYPGAVDEFETLRGMLYQGFPNDFFPQDEALLKPFDPASIL